MSAATTDNDPVTRVRQGFETHFGTPPSLVVQAPGRVNLIGEHTDYNDGFVLPCAIDFHTVVALRPRHDDVIEVIAFEQGGETDSFSVAGEIARTGKHGWQDYVRGAFEILRQRGYPVRGMQLAITGNVPQGAGLSSSASLLVAIITACKISAGFDDLDPKHVAVVARAVETDFVGIKCGIMDQMISACGEAGHALLIDCRSLDIQPVALHPDLTVLIVHSGVKRGLVESEYNRRREECERAAAFLGVKALRDADMTMLEAVRGGLDDVAWRRARHIITENRRVLDAVSVLGNGNTSDIHALLQASHVSMRDDFEITTPKIDELVAIVQKAIGDAGGVRMTGGGFGGCIVAVLRRDALPRALDAVRTDYTTPDGTSAVYFVCSPSAGADIVL